MNESDNEDLRERMTDAPDSGGTSKLQDPKVMAKLNRYWGQHEEVAPVRNESVEAMRARNAAIRLSKGLKTRGADGSGKKDGREFKVQRFDDFDCVRFNLFYPADYKPGQPNVRIKRAIVALAGMIQADYEGFVGKSLEEAEAEFNEELDRDKVA